MCFISYIYCTILWEFTQYILHDQIYDEAVADFDDGKLDMLIDGAYLAAGVMSLIDEDEVVEDSTQIPSADSRRRKEEKMKQYGIAPTM